MRIHNNMNVSNVLKAYNKNVSKIEKTSKATVQKDKIEISETAKDFNTAINAFKALPEVRQEKINELKAAIDSGSYNPSAEEVADKIIERSKFDMMG